MKTGPQAGLVVPDIVGMVNVVPSRSDLMQEGGSSVGMVILVRGCDTLALHITSLVAGVGVLWGGSRGACGSMMVQVVHASPQMSSLLSYCGYWGLHMSLQSGGSCSLSLGLYSSPSSLSPLSSCAGTCLLPASLCQSHHPILTSSSPLTSSFVSPNMVCPSSASVLSSPLTLPFVSPGVTASMSIVASLVVATAVSGFISLAGSVVVVWVGLNMMEASVSHAIRFVVGVGIVVGDSLCLMVVVGGGKC